MDTDRLRPDLNRFGLVGPLTAWLERFAAGVWAVAHIDGEYRVVVGADQYVSPVSTQVALARACLALGPRRPVGVDKAGGHR